MHLAYQKLLSVLGWSGDSKADHSDSDSWMFAPSSSEYKILSSRLRGIATLCHLTVSVSSLFLSQRLPDMPLPPHPLCLLTDKTASPPSGGLP